MSSPQSQYEEQRIKILEGLEGLVPNPLCSRLRQLIRPSIVLEHLLPEVDSAPLASAVSTALPEPPLGTSKFGGSPDVPVGFSWPHFHGRPLEFVAQLDLEALAVFDIENLLPKSGLLSFWISGTNKASNEFGSWQVFHFEAKQWQKLTSPKPRGVRALFSKRGTVPNIPPIPVRYEMKASLASVWGADVESERKLLPELEMAYSVSEVFGGEGHQLLGFPDSLANKDVRVVCAEQWNDFLGSHRAQAKGLHAQNDVTGWEDWMLLFNINWDYLFWPLRSFGLKQNMSWGCDNATYFLIRRTDLEEKRFDLCWSLFQTYNMDI